MLKATRLVLAAGRRDPRAERGRRRVRRARRSAIRSSSAPTCATGRSPTPRRGSATAPSGTLGEVVLTAAASNVAAARIERLREATAEAGLDAFVATADESIAYLTGFRPLQLERLFAVVVRAAGGGGVVVPKLDRGPDRRTRPTALARVSYDASSNGLPELAALLDGARRVGVEEDHLDLRPLVARSAARGYEPVAGRRRDLDLRARKDEERDRGRPPRLRARRAVVRVRVGGAAPRHRRSAS